MTSRATPEAVAPEAVADVPAAPAPRPSSGLAVVAAVNDEDSLARNLAASPMIASGRVPLHAVRGATGAAAAYNRGLDAASAAYVVFAHQDVYFPPDWEARFDAAVAATAARDPDWALLGPFGVSEQAPRHVGRIWTTSLGRVVGEPAPAPVAVQSYDELAFVLRADGGLRFDEALPGWHLYGTDIVQEARARGLGAWAMDMPVIHNDGFHRALGADFVAAYRFAYRKWAGRRPPFRTPIVPVTRLGLPLMIQRLRMATSVARRRAMCLDPGEDPRVYAARCGWDGE